MESTQPKPSLQNTLPGADPAEVSQLLSTIEYQKDLLNGFQHQLLTLQATNEHLTQYIRSLPAPRPDPVRFALPDKFDGSPDNCIGFLRQCSIYFSNQPETYHQDHTKCSFIMTLLTGKALEWATAVWDHDTHIQQSYSYFTQLIRDVFQYPAGGMDAATQLTQLRQGNRPASDYAIQFRTLAAQSGFNDVALKHIFLSSLSAKLQAELLCKDDSLDFFQFVTLAIKIDNLLRTQPSPKSNFAYVPTITAQTPCQSVPTEAMQIGRTHLPPDERRRRLLNQLCFYCGESGHRCSDCPVKPAANPSSSYRVSHRFNTLQISLCLSLPIILSVANQDHHFSALIDSGAAANVIHQDLVKQLNIPTTKCEPPIAVTAVDDGPVGKGHITHQTLPIKLRVGLFHMEEITLYVISSPRNQVILGYPWLSTHDPQFSWKERELVSWSPHCHSHCLELPTKLPVCMTHLAKNPISLPTNVPTEYADLAEVFSKDKATKLPPHRPWDCAIDLLPNTSPPKSRVYPLSIPETKAMEEYIEEALSYGFIRPSTSPAASGFFFVDKKDGGLRPCIDYRALNAITVKNRHPLPLIPSSLEQLREASYFTKLDLRSANNLIRIREGDEWKTAFLSSRGHYEYLVMPFGLANAPSIFQSFVNEVFKDLLNQYVIVYIDDILIYSCSMEDHISHVRTVLSRLLQNGLFVKAEKCEFHVTSIKFLGYNISHSGVEMDDNKVKAVTDWPIPSTVKELQRFLGFANFYRRFIRDFSTIAAPVTSLLKGKPKKLVWTEAATSAINKLKSSFTTAPILKHPDPKLPFIVEVDASDCGIGAVLSQHHGTPGKLHPCAFFSRKLTPAENNYNIGNKELLSIKAALEEWRHWLEGALHPFQVITDHKNLEYIKDAKRLNPRQARWALFFTRFNFSVTYRPGSKNSKADALSRIHDSANSQMRPETILPPSIIIAPIQWDIMEEIQHAQHEEPSPPECPAGKIYVPTSLRNRIIQWVHTSPASGHPGINRTTALVRNSFWWHTLSADVSNYVSACQICAQSRTPRQLPAGLLEPLPIPQRPWSHLSIDFVTDLPNSQGFTTIMVY
uniref:Gypsy retrotransposon integrase-like protein 1 n=1 Tax=Cyprinus carpio carpio TaxID=630221 RepID=A0A9J7ZGW9_CYPCA